MRHARDIAALRAKLIVHLEAAQAITDETGDGVVGYLVERALDELRSSMWPANLNLPG